MILDQLARVKNAATATGATVGFDAGKLVKGRKRLVLTDTLGHVLASRVLPAVAVDGPVAIAFWDEVNAAHDLLGQVQVVFVDSSFNGVFREYLAQRYGVRVEKLDHVLVEKTNFCIHAWRWIVERTFAWLSANRRLSKKYERGLRHANAWICLANIRQVLKLCQLKQFLKDEGEPQSSGSNCVGIMSELQPSFMWRVFQAAIR